MAVTQGHGNPRWTRDETLLALALYFDVGGKVPSPRAPEVRALSEILRSLPYHAEVAKQPTFRNPDGVGFKLMNIRQVATGRGLGNVSSMDRQIWAEYGDRPSEVSKIAVAIKAGITVASSEPLPDIETELPEGRLLTSLHVRRERSPKTRKLILNARRSEGLRCEACGMSKPHLEPAMQEALFETHHLVPLAEAGETKTKLSDLALLCACCHRLIHRAMVLKARWVSIDALRAIVAPNSPHQGTSALAKNHINVPNKCGTNSC